MRRTQRAYLELRVDFFEINDFFKTTFFAILCFVSFNVVSYQLVFSHPAERIDNMRTDEGVDIFRAKFTYFSGS